MTKHTKPLKLTFPQIQPSDNGTFGENPDSFLKRIAPLLPDDIEEEAIMVVKEQLISNLHNDIKQDMAFLNAIAEHVLSTADPRGYKAWQAYRSKKEFERTATAAITTATPEQALSQHTYSSHAEDLYHRRVQVGLLATQEKKKLAKIVCSERGSYDINSWNVWRKANLLDTWRKRDQRRAADEYATRAGATEGMIHNNEVNEMKTAEKGSIEEVATMEETEKWLKAGSLEQARRNRNKCKKNKKIANKKALGARSPPKAERGAEEKKVVHELKSTDDTGKCGDPEKSIQEVEETKVGQIERGERNEHKEHTESEEREELKEPEEPEYFEECEKPDELGVDATACSEICPKKQMIGDAKRDWRNNLYRTENIMNHRSLGNDLTPQDILHGNAVALRPCK